MASIPEHILKDALALPDAQRADLVLELLASLDPATPAESRDADEWIAELERRARAALEGSPALSWERARAHIESRIRRG